MYFPANVVREWRTFQLCCAVVLIGFYVLTKCNHVDYHRNIVDAEITAQRVIGE